MKVRASSEITPGTLKPNDDRSRTGPHAITWNLILDGGDDGEKPGSTLYRDAATKLGEVPEVALVAVPGLFEDLQNDREEQMKF